MLTKTRVVLAVLVAVSLALAAAWTVPARAQTNGATMTVLRGAVAVRHPDGSAVQPAPSGIVVFPGDQISTVGPSNALITFFSGTEIELGADTTLEVQQVTQQGTHIEVSLKQVFGMTISRIQTFADPGSAYRIEAGGAVALIRGSETTVAGPTSMGTGNYVVFVCRNCGPRDLLIIPGVGTFPLGPGNYDYGFLVEKLRNGQWVEDGSLLSVRFGPNDNPYDVVSQLLEALHQRDMSGLRGQPPGNVGCPGCVGAEIKTADPDENDKRPESTTTSEVSTSATDTATSTSSSSTTVEPPVTSTGSSTETHTTTTHTTTTTSEGPPIDEGPGPPPSSHSTGGGGGGGGIEPPICLPGICDGTGTSIGGGGGAGSCAAASCSALSDPDFMASRGVPSGPPDPLAATGTLLVLGMLGWSASGYRRGRRD